VPSDFNSGRRAVIEVGMGSFEIEQEKTWRFII